MKASTLRKMRATRRKNKVKLEARKLMQDRVHKDTWEEQRRVIRVVLMQNVRQ
jgi:hypothetical protein